MKDRIVHRNFYRLWMVRLSLAAAVLQPLVGYGQEKKNLRVVFTSLAWNSEIPFRVALARGFFKAQGLEIQPIFVRGGPAAMAALVYGGF
jgi:ABC-type nitrate/sulfonate/bicarbonate transport system substrate-binding protein